MHSISTGNVGPRRDALTSAWPDLPSAGGPGKRVRDQLDYLAWVAEAAEALGLHGPPELDAWRERVQRAYTALVDPMMSGHGDPLPPDVPPSTRPGTWPDVPAAAIEGMTVRHQLTVVRTIADQSRRQGAVYHQPPEASRWAARVQAAAAAMDHGAALPMPDSARTQPAVLPPAPPRAGKRPSKGARKAAAKKKRARPKGKARRAKRSPRAGRRR